MWNEVLEISAIAYGGDGVGRLNDGRVCFVPGVVPGEKAEVRIVAEKSRFLRGKAEKIIQGSALRQTPPCPLAGSCPGCAYMHMDYACEVEWKNRQLQDFLVRSRLASPELFAEPFASPSELFYRNKLVLHGDGNCCGYIAEDNRSIIPVSKCFLAAPEINEILKNTSSARTLYRKSSMQKHAVIIDPDDPGILRENLSGAGEFAVAGDGFFQTNMPVAAELLREVRRAVKASGCRNLLELYCGVGVFSIALAEADENLHCTGIELNGKAISFARKNAAEHQVAGRCRFYAGDAGKALKRYQDHPEFTVLADPPRSGMEKAALQKLIRVNAQEIIYISCAADTLVRDLKTLCAAGYAVKYVRMLDMFPRTAHFEVLCVVQKQ
ncbi:MAG: class I SAM-dependent RNA methyltransferase [Lentisphaeria bacterium]|nr:class I SAM-dependent RNA methyltransferase [Lentisphaeria bacterium]